MILWYTFTITNGLSGFKQLQMILYSSWLKLPIHIRHKIAADFGIVKKGSTHVFNNEIQSDGFLIHEVEAALSVEALQAFLGTRETDHITLWNEMVYRAENPDEVFIPMADVVIDDIPKQLAQEMIKNDQGTLAMNVNKLTHKKHAKTKKNQ